MVTMTDDQRAVLAHVVVDPDEWLEHAIVVLGEDKAASALQDKVVRWEPHYISSKAKDGKKYKTRQISELDTVA
jgi:hypothetical protein